MPVSAELVLLLPAPVGLLLLVLILERLEDRLRLGPDLTAAADVAAPPVGIPAVPLPRDPQAFEPAT